MTSGLEIQNPRLLNQTEKILPVCGDIQAYTASALSALSLLLLFKLYKEEDEEEEEGQTAKNGNEKARQKE